MSGIFCIVLIAAFTFMDFRVALAQETIFASIRELEVAAARGAREPSLFATTDGRILLSWIEPAGGSFAVRFVTGDENGWTKPRSIIESGVLFVNWADFPSVVAYPDGTMAAHWLQKNGGASYAYDVNIALSKDGGQHWSKPIVPHGDQLQRQHGFVTMLPVSSNELLTLWLDGRNYESAGTFGAGNEASTDAMALRSAIIASDGVVSEETVLDPRTCTCCQTSAAIASAGNLVVAYRDRTENEIRDISIVRRVNGNWTEPLTVNEDGWKIEGCPVNGPAIDALGEDVAVAWFTAAQDIPRVNVAFSKDAGASFEKPVRVDNGDPAGRVDLLLLPDGSALVSWLELTKRGEELLVCQVAANKPCGRPMGLFVSRQGRTSGFPRMVRSGVYVYFAWTQPEPDTSSAEGGIKVRTVVGKLKANQ